MKFYLLLFCILIAIPSYGQNHYVNFDNIAPPFYIDYRDFISIDTVNYKNNRWQIGMPQKSFFSTGFFDANALMTDTVATTARADTSVFILKLPKKDVWFPGLPEFVGPLYEISFNYRLEVDSHARAIFELSEDGGLNWINTADSIPVDHYWFSGTLPTQLNYSTVGTMGFSFSRGFDVSGYDSSMYRFTFIRDSTFTKAGWMIEEINFWYYYEGSVQQNDNDAPVRVYPNPSGGKISLLFSKKATGTKAFSVCDLLGQVYYSSIDVSSSLPIELLLPNGNYILRYSDELHNYSEKIIIKQ